MVQLNKFGFVDEKKQGCAEGNMNEECLICKAPLTYLEADMLMECEICHKKENSKTRCVNGHYVCNECHTLRSTISRASYFGRTDSRSARLSAAISGSRGENDKYRLLSRLI